MFTKFDIKYWKIYLWLLIFFYQVWVSRTQIFETHSCENEPYVMFTQIEIICMEGKNNFILLFILNV